MLMYSNFIRKLVTVRRERSERGTFRTGLAAGVSVAPNAEAKAEATAKAKAKAKAAVA